ncbi:MAG TPA: aldehyde dehydrogenase family protein, partial [Burkholderiaceae bacterium]|nr:aldehyde dehydrogenase family protein [Burkholderiaceae bacterium]
MQAQALTHEAILSPYDGSKVGDMPVCSAEDIERSIGRAQAAYQVMRKLPRFARADVLVRAAEIVRARRDEFARLIAAEAGKPLYDAR